MCRQQWEGMEEERCAGRRQQGEGGALDGAVASVPKVTQPRDEVLGLIEVAVMHADGGAFD